MSFISSTIPPDDTHQKRYWIGFQKRDVFLHEENNTILPNLITGDADLPANNKQRLFIGTLNRIPCYAISFEASAAVPESVRRFSLRELITLLDSETFKAVMTASQVIQWDRNFRYCGHCGTPTTDIPDERAKKCPACGLVSFPRISPAIMVAVVKQDKLLLANGVNFPPDMYSVLAGFVEPGETLEECVAREVEEEVGLKIKDLTYFSSQYWPFPDSLMIAFTARHESGEICVDNKEINKAGWYGAGALPSRPSSKISISGQLIDWFEDTYG